jgi:hypothetical protein
MNDLQHDVFGKLVWDADYEHYKTTCGEGDSAFGLSFSAPSREEIDALLSAATQLWQKRGEWLVNWREACFEYYMETLKDAWYEGKEPLDTDVFNAKLGQPTSIGFTWDDGKLRYMITGMGDDLVGDHCLEAHGTDLRPDEICLT